MNKQKVFTKEKIIEENKQHREDVLNLAYLVARYFRMNVLMHDLDKDVPENAEILANALNTGNFNEWNKLHLEKQRHHAEWINNHIYEGGADLFDLLEMVVDGCVANLRREGEFSTYEDKVRFFESKGFDPFMSSILANTFIKAQELFVEIFDRNKEVELNENKRDN